MKISEYIQQLQTFQNAVGDADVMAQGFNGVYPARGPKSENLRINSKRESKVATWSSFDGEAKKGPKVIRLS